MKNVQKCRHYLSTLMQLASSEEHSTETAAKLKELGQSLLDGKMEAEELTSTLQGDLKASL